MTKSAITRIAKIVKWEAGMAVADTVLCSGAAINHAPVSTMEWIVANADHAAAYIPGYSNTMLQRTNELASAAVDRNASIYNRTQVVRLKTACKLC